MEDRPLTVEQATETLDDLDVAANILAKLIKKMEGPGELPAQAVRRKISLVKSWLDDALEHTR